MRKFNLIWIMAFLLFMPIAISDNYFMLIHADDNPAPDVSTRCDGNPDCEVEKVGTGLFLLTSDTSESYETQRANLMDAMFSQDPIEAAGSYDYPFFRQLVWNNTYFANITKIQTPEEKDWGRYVTYASLSAISNNDGSDLYFYFEDTTTNTDSNMWCAAKADAGGGSPKAYYVEGAGSYFCCQVNGGPGGTCNTYSTWSGSPGDQDNRDYAAMNTGSGDPDNYASMMFTHKGNFSSITHNRNTGTGGSPYIYMTFGVNGSGLYLGDMNDPGNVPQMSEAGVMFFINALDNYTKYGYNYTDILNFSYSMTNGTTTLSGTADGDSILAGLDIEGLWNVSVWKDLPDEYTNRTYLNHNVSSDLTAYLSQTHLHEDLVCGFNTTSNTSRCVYATFIRENYPSDSFYTTGRLEMEVPTSDNAYILYNIFWYEQGNATSLSDAEVHSPISLWTKQYNYNCGSQNQVFNFYEQYDCDQRSYDISTITWNNYDHGASCSERAISTEAYCKETNTWLEWGFGNDNLLAGESGNPPTFIEQLFISSEQYNIQKYRGSTYTTEAERPYVVFNAYTNFTMSFYDSVTGDPITLVPITINISNGAWSREDTISGTNEIVYPFDEGIYNISITVEGVEETYSNYDLSTEYNYLEHDFTFYFNMTNCSDDSSDIALNFTILDEETGAKILGDVTPSFDLSTDFYTQTYSPGELENQDNWTFCLTPDNIDVTMSGFIQYEGVDSSSYPYMRTYEFIDATIRGDTTQDVELYLLNGSAPSAETTFTVTRDGQLINGGTIRILRYMGGDYVLTWILMLNPDGTGVADLRHADTFYKFLVYDDDGSLIGTFGPTTVGATMTLNTFTSQSFDTSWADFLQLRDYSYSFDYDNATNVSSLTYSHSSGLSSEDALRVVYSTFTDDSQVCYSTSTGAAATLQCLITDQDATYTLQYLTYYNGTWYIRAAEQLSLTETLADHIGNDGLFFAFLVIGVLAFVGLFNPAAAIIFGLSGLIFVVLLGLIELSVTALVGLIFVGGLIAFKSRT